MLRIYDDNSSFSISVTRSSVQGESKLKCTVILLLKLDIVPSPISVARS